ncbi:MAG TPA: hypothetical protein VK943_00795 [Arenibaculum sp.]|nr:hypothetical protein [Arenibaculum sp.]
MSGFNLNAISLAAKQAPEVIVGAAVASGATFIALGYFQETLPITLGTPRKTIFDILGTMGELVLVGGVFAGILKFL